MSDTFRPTPRKPITTEERVAALEERIEAHERATTAAQASMVELARQEAASIRNTIAAGQKEIADDIHAIGITARDASDRCGQLRSDLSATQTQVRLLTERPEFDLRRSEVPINGLDVTDALEWSLRHKSKDHEIIVPPGSPSGARPRWQLSRTLEFPRQHGGAIRFVGESSNNHATGLHCELEWTGEPGGPMFLYSSTDWRFKGSPKFYGNNKCGIGFLTTKVGSYNAGRMDWDGASWYDFADAGIQIGKTVPENSNECNQWGRQSFHRMPVGFRVVGHQALLQSFDYVFFSGNVGVGFQYYASGCLYVDECYFNGLLLELNAAGQWTPGTDGKSTGKNNGVFVVRNLKSDTSAANPQLIRCNNSIRADVVFDCGVISGGDTKTGPVMQLKPMVYVTCRNMRMLGGGGTIEGEGGTVLLDACRRVSKVGTFRDDVRGAVHLIQRDCVDYDGVPFASAPQGLTLDDVRREIESAKVVPQ